MTPDLFQLRLYVGDKYLVVRVPTLGSAPVITGELIDPKEAAIEVFGLFGSYEATVVWTEGDSAPTVNVTPPGMISKARKK